MNIPAVSVKEGTGSGWHLPRLGTDDFRSLMRQMAFSLEALDGMLQ